MTDDKLYTSLSANTIMAILTNHVQRTRLNITSSTDKHHSLDSEDDFRSGCRNVSHQQQFFSELHSPGRSHYTKLFIIGKKSTPHSKTEMMSQTIWNNKFITIDKKMVYLPHWHRAGIKQISDLFDEHENCFLPFLSLCNKYTLNYNFLRYHSLLSAIPKS